MAAIAFIGLGNMGLPMARNLIGAGHALVVFDLLEAAMAAAVETGAKAAASAAQAADGAEIVISMLPAGEHVRDALAGAGGVLEAAKPGALVIDSSTIDVATARDMCHAASARGLDMVDAPVSGGVAGAVAATLTFMVGGAAAAFERARPVLEQMGKTIVHAGAAGNGQAAKICNNLMLGIQMISVSEAFNLAQKLGLEAQTLFDISSNATGRCWSLNNYCPAPGPVEGAPSNSNYKAGFTAAMMLKDLRLAVEAAEIEHVATPLGAAARSVYAAFCAGPGAGLDFSGVIRHLRGEI